MLNLFSNRNIVFACLADCAALFHLPGTPVQLRSPARTVFIRDVRRNHKSNKLNLIFSK